MSARITQGDNGYWEFGISGQLRKAELDAVKAAIATGLSAAGDIKPVVVLEDFQGWSTQDDWSDISFAADIGDAVEKIAVVGEPAWEAETLMFMGAGYRKTVIKYFQDVQAARAWLSGSVA